MSMSTKCFVCFLSLAFSFPAFSTSIQSATVQEPVASVYSAQEVAKPESVSLPPELALVSNALAALGVQYRFGGRSESALDCSGFIKQVYERTFGMVLPPTAKLISQVGTSIGFEDLKVGDLIFFNTLRRPFSHVGMYLGEGRFIHASSMAKQVKIDMLDGYYKQRIDGYRRINPK